MEEFKAGKHVDWDPNYETNFWKEIEVELAEAAGEGKAVGNPSTPRVESPRTSEPVDVEVSLDVATLGEGTSKELSEEYKEIVHEKATLLKFTYFWL